MLFVKSILSCTPFFFNLMVLIYNLILIIIHAYFTTSYFAEEYANVDCE
jgi:hypothetical protein